MTIETDNYSIFRTEEGYYYVGRIMIMTTPIHKRVSKEYETKEQALRKLKKIIVK
jgi:hypothetical protein